MWYTQLGKRVLEGKEAAFYLLAAQETVRMLSDASPEEIDWYLPPTFDSVFDNATPAQKIVLLHEVLLALLDPSIPEPKLTNVVEAAAYLPFEVMKLKIEEEIEMQKLGAWVKEDGETLEFYYRLALQSACQSLNWKVDVDIERPRIRSYRSINVELWHQTLEALAGRIFWDDDWRMTARCEGFLEGKHPEVVQWGGLTDYLTAQLPIVFNAQVKMAVGAIRCWTLPTTSKL